MTSDMDAIRARLQEEAPQVLAAIEVACSRITSGQAPMRIPAEPYADPDIVLAKCGVLIRALLAENERLERANQAIGADLLSIGRQCGQREDEYPLQAVARLTAEVERLRREHGEH